MTPPVVAGINGMPRLELTHDSGSMAHIYLHGAQVTSWTPVGWHGMLYLSHLANFAPGEAIRGGMPVVFPQFADSGPLPKHGWLRTSEWRVSERDAGEAEDSTHAVLFTEDSEASRRIWPHAYRAELDATLGERTLTIRLSIFNTGPDAFSFTAALHNYFFVGEVREARIEGLEGLHYLDKTDGFSEKTESVAELAIDGATDRIYRKARAQVMLHDHATGAALQIDTTGFRDIVVWNPWEEDAKQIADMPDDDYARMLCIEPAIADSQFTLGPGERWTGAQQLTIRS